MFNRIPAVLTNDVRKAVKKKRDYKMSLLVDKCAHVTRKIAELTEKQSELIEFGEGSRFKINSLKNQENFPIHNTIRK